MGGCCAGPATERGQRSAGEGAPEGSLPRTRRSRGGLLLPRGHTAPAPSPSQGPGRAQGPASMPTEVMAKGLGGVRGCPPLITSATAYRPHPGPSRAQEPSLPHSSTGHESVPAAQCGRHSNCPQADKSRQGARAGGPLWLGGARGNCSQPGRQEMRPCPVTLGQQVGGVPPSWGPFSLEPELPSVLQPDDTPQRCSGYHSLFFL